MAANADWRTLARGVSLDFNVFIRSQVISEGPRSIHSLRNARGIEQVILCLPTGLFPAERVPAED